MLPKTYKHSEETLKKMRGKICSEEKRKKLSLSNIGKHYFKHTDEAKRKIGLASIGNQFAKGMKPNKTSFKKGVRSTLGMLGKKHSETTKFKMRQSAKKGVENHNWKGGITPENKKIRESQDYKQWRKHVFNRDRYTCQACGQIGGKLHVDHELPFSIFPDLRLEILNGRVLCIPCHRKTPSWADRRAQEKIYV